jgi:hypothetical protein
MKSIQERILKGRDFAYGIDQPIDIDLAFEMWDGIEDALNEEDRETYNIIKEVLFGEETIAASGRIDPKHQKFLDEWGDMLFSGYDSSPYSHTETIAKRSSSCTEADIEAIFREAMKIAKEKDKISVVYTALKRCIKGMTEVQDDEHTRALKNYGNNVNHYIVSIFGSLTGFMSYLKKQAGTMKYPPKKISKNSIYMVTGGNNRMSDLNLLALLELGEKYAPSRFARKIEIKDFDLEADEFKKLIKKRF